MTMPRLASRATVRAQVDAKDLSGKSFRFSWKSAAGSDVNGIATLKADGMIEGIQSPNESTWSVDEAGNLLFKHANGKVSTRFTKATLVDGLLCFEGPFLLRDGITHFLVEVGNSGTTPPMGISDQQAQKISYSSQHFVYLDPGESVAVPLKNGRTKTVRLVSVKEHRDSVINLARSAEVVVDIDGQSITLACASICHACAVQRAAHPGRYDIGMDEPAETGAVFHLGCHRADCRHEPVLFPTASLPIAITGDASVQRAGSLGRS